MDAIALLMQQHREVEELFEAFEDSEDDEEKSGIFEEIADNLAIHASIEALDSAAQIRWHKDRTGRIQRPARPNRRAALAAEMGKLIPPYTVNHGRFNQKSFAALSVLRNGQTPQASFTLPILPVPP